MCTILYNKERDKYERKKMLLQIVSFRRIYTHIDKNIRM
jgi:hypothetical protein